MIRAMGSLSIRLHDQPENAYGYWVDLDTVTLSEDGSGIWLQAMPYKKYSHPVHGSIEFNQERAQRFADNVKNNVRGQDLDIDYDHKEKTGEAAGWVKDAQARSDGLYLFVEFTREAFDKLKNKAYRYFSPEYVDEWSHPETGVKHQDVLFGGALTNRPFLKGILPINLSELTGDDNRPPKEGTNVDRAFLEGLAKKLGVDYTPETSEEDLVKLVMPAVEDLEIIPEGDSGKKDPVTEPTKEPVAASETLVKLAETNSELKILLEEREQNKKRLEALEVSNRLSEVTIQLNDINSDKVRLTPVATEKLQKLMLESPKQLSDRVVELVKDIMKDGTVRLGELGRSGEPSNSDGAATAFDTEVRKLTERANNALSFADAVEEVSKTHPELFAQYREESYLFREA